MGGGWNWDGIGLGVGIDNLYNTAPAYWGPYDALAYPATLGVFGAHDLASFPHYTTYGSTLRGSLAAQGARTVALNNLGANGIGLYGLNSDPIYSGFGPYVNDWGLWGGFYDPLAEVYSPGIGKAFGNAANIAALNLAGAGLGVTGFGAGKGLDVGQKGINPAQGINPMQGYNPTQGINPMQGYNPAQRLY